MPDRLTYFISLLICLTLCSVTAFAQLPQYQLSRIAEQDGLKTGDVININTDRKGYLWLVLQSQVQRFDGKHTQHFPFSETVSNLYNDHQNNIWVSTFRRLYKKEENRLRFTKIEFNDIDSSAIEAVFEREGKGLFALRRTGLYHFNETTQTMERMPASYNVIDDNINGFITNSGFEYWCNADSITRYDPATGATISIGMRSRYSVHPINADQLLVSTTGFDTWLVNMLNGQKQKLLIPSNKTSGAPVDFLIFSAEEIGDNKQLLATNKGLLEFNCSTNTITVPVFYFNGEPLRNQSTIRKIFRDQQGNFFMSHADGIFQNFSNGTAIQYFRNYSVGNKAMPDNDVRNFTEDEEGNIWMATTNGIAKINMVSGELTVMSPSDINNPIELPSYRQLLNDGPYIWIGSSGNGVWVYHKQTRQFLRPRIIDPQKEARDTSLYNTYIWKLLKLRNGQMLVIGGGRCYLIDPATLQGKRSYFASADKNSRSAWQDSSGRIWHGTTTGVYCFNDHFRRLFHMRDSFPDLRIAAFCEWQKDKMLIGTKGLYEVVMDADKAIAFHQKKAIPSDRFIYCMKQDSKGMVWLGTDDGIYRYDPFNETAVLYDRYDYVQSQAFNSDAAFLSKSGLMFMGGKNGVNYFDPLTVRSATSILQPAIASFTINGDDSSWRSTPDPIRIKYSDRDIDFIISAPEYREPFNIRYRYRFHDNAAWINNGNNDQVRVVNLEPGNYTLQVAASVDGTNWFDTSSPLAFVVTKPWWQTWWFRTLYIFFIGAVIWAYSRYRQQQYKAEERKQAVNYFALSGDKHSSTADILWDIARNCISRLGFEDCVFYLLDDERNMLVQKAAYGEKSPKDFEIVNPIEVPVGQGITGAVAASGKSICISDTSKDNRYIVDDENRLSELAVPVLHDGKVIGVIDSEHHKRNFFTAQHQATLEQIAGICSSKIARAMAEESVQKAEQQLQDLDVKMTESKFMNLRLQMNPHFLFNILTSIQYLVVSGQTAKATKYLNVFSKFLRALLHFAEATVVSLQEELKVLHMYVELETLSLDESFNYSIDIDDEIDQDETLVPFMLLQPFIENAIHHGLVPKVGEKKFCIQIEDIDEAYMQCRIVDNGVGRKRAEEIKLHKMRAAHHQSRGVGIVQERLDLLEKRTGKAGSVSYQDLYDDEHNPCGTSVTIIIPYYTNTELYD